MLAQADLRAIGVPNDRVEAVRALARAFSAGRISFGTGAEAQQVVDALCRIRGVAASMAQWVAMRALREPDAFPSDDSPCSAAFNPSSLVVVLFAQALGPRECRAEEPYCL